MDFDILLTLEYYNLVSSLDVQDRFKIVCPFHADDDASLYIDLNRGTYFCYGCAETGDAIKFIQTIEDINSLQAMLVYCKIQKGAKNSGRLKTVVRSKPIDPKVALKEARIYFYSLSKPSWSYISSNYMLSRGFTTGVLKEVDIKIGSDPSYRIICPIKDCGSFKGYVKRRTDGNDKENKYLYNKGFRRKLVVMGNYDIGGWIPVTEGYMDWLKLIQNGCDNAVAIFGWEIMPKQIAKLQKHTKYIISALDNTPTGEKGTRLLEEYFHVVRFQFPEECKDVGDMSERQFNKAWNDTLIKIRKYKE